MVIWVGCRQCLTEIWGAPEDGDQVNLEMHFGGWYCANFEIHLGAEIEWTQECTWTQWEWVWSCNWRPWLCNLDGRESKFGDTLGGHNGVNLGIHSGAMIKRVWRCTCRPWSNKTGGVLGGGRSGGSRREASHVLTHYTSASKLATMRMWHGANNFEAVMEGWVMAVNL